jgi:DNA-binding response OmpR family regulator
MIEILLVEDDIAIIEALQKFLQSENFKAYTANGQKQAEEILE